jgi:hypothetical protein
MDQSILKNLFYDLYAIIQLKSSIPEVCTFFKERFAKSGLNFYQVLKSLTFFEDADNDPAPRLLGKSKTWKWTEVTAFFIRNIHQFQKYLLPASMR